MTKARDLAGFASSSVTTTASDGLVLKGDGTTTDVIIKNGANATVASVADGTVNIAAAGSITATGASVGALARGSIQVGNSSGVAAALAKGAAGTFLTSNGTDLSYAAINTSDPAVIFPNWASPTTTYTTSGTWSKGSLDDDDYVWLYLIGGGGGGSTYYNSQNQNASGGHGGYALLLYGKAGLLNGGAYVIGAGVAGQAGTGGSPNGTNSTFTLTSANGSLVFTTTNGDAALFKNARAARVVDSNLPTIAVDVASNLTFTLGAEPEGWTNSVSGCPYHWNNGQGGEYAVGYNSIFAAAGGGGAYNNASRVGGGSLYGGQGGALTSSGENGSVPGGGGGGSTTYNASSNPASGSGGTGANGNMRQYNV